MYLNLFQTNVIINLKKIVALKCFEWEGGAPVIRFYTSFDGDADNGYRDVHFETKELRDVQYEMIINSLMRDNYLSIRQNEK